MYCDITWNRPCDVHQLSWCAAIQLPQMPSVYSAELVNLIRAMLNKAAEKRPSVSRVLRDPYIKRNIALFLEETRTRFLIITKVYVVWILLSVLWLCWSGVRKSIWSLQQYADVSAKTWESRVRVQVFIKCIQQTYTGWPKKFGTIILYALTLPNINRWRNQWRRRLECVVQQQGGHTKHLM